MSMKFGVLY